MTARCLPALLALLALTDSLFADVKLPAFFGDHMVLQEGKTLPIWGTATAGEAVTVTLGSATMHATADASGKWRVDLPPQGGTATPLTLTVTGKNTVTCSDVLVGDVWLCTGQSNMEFPMIEAATADTDMPKANDPLLRVFLVGEKTALDPLSDVSGQWELCTPETISKFSAIGYYFGRELRAHLNKPIGLIGTYWGGTPAQAWTSLSGLEKEPTLKGYVDEVAAIRAKLPANGAGDAEASASSDRLEEWKKKYGAAYLAGIKKWRNAVKAATAANQVSPPRPTFPPDPPKVVSSDGGSNTAANLYNGMIAPLIPYAMKGVIWYQGEGNAGRASEYGVLFPCMIKDWREKWGAGDFPFLFVQLASYTGGPKGGKSAPIQNWPFLREAQLKTLALPNTGMAVAADVGSPDTIHPKDKLDVGHRLALTAFHVAYGEKLVYSGPIYASMKVEGSEAHLSFTQAGGGLIIGSAPWVAPGHQPLPTDKLVGFTIAGADKNFVPADARITGDEVIVSSPQVPSPAAVRYDWANVAEGNLYNKEQLPASPFRTDDWIDPVAMGLDSKMK